MPRNGNGRDAEPITANALTAQIIEYLWSLGAYAWRNNTGRRGGIRFGHVGSGDILGVLPGGRALSIEVKAGGDEEREDQAKFRAAISTLGALAFVARNLDEVKLVMRGERLDNSNLVRAPIIGTIEGERQRIVYTPTARKEFAR